MSPARDSGASDRHAGARRAADALALAASPIFAIMAVVTGVGSDDVAAALCSSAHASPMGGMMTMYLLMSALHFAPWLKRISVRRR